MQLCCGAPRGVRAVAAFILLHAAGGHGCPAAGGTGERKALIPSDGHHGARDGRNRGRGLLLCFYPL